MERFSFGNAISHWSKTDGSKGFIWKYLATYTVCTIAFVIAVGFGATLIMNMVFGDLSDRFIMRRAMNDSFALLILFYVLGAVIALVFWSIFEASMQRRYVRGARFSIGFGADELRLMVVGLWWMLMLLVVYFVSAFVFGLVTMPFTMALGDSPLVAGIVVLVAGLLVAATVLFFVVKWAPAAAMTIRDRRIVFFSAWGLTNGKEGSMYGAYITLLLILGIVWAILYAAILLVFAAPMGGMSGLAPRAPGPIIAVLGLILYLSLITYQAFSGFVVAGIGALVAKTDPAYAGEEAAAVFE